MIKMLGLFLIICTVSSSLNAQGWNLENFLRKFEENNLEIQIAKDRWLAAKAYAQGNPVEAPKFSLIEKKYTDQTARGFEFMLSLPFPSQYIAEKSTRNNSAKLEELKYRKRYQQVSALASNTYIRWAIEWKKNILIQKRIEISKVHIGLTRAGVRSDSLAKIHLLEAESELVSLENSLLDSKLKIKSLEMNIKSLLNLGKVEKLDPPNLPQISDPAEVAKGALISDIEIATQSSFLATSELDMAKSSWYPKIELSLMKMDETRDMAGFTQINVGLRLNFLNPWEQNARVRLKSYDLSRTNRQEAQEKLNTELNIDFLLTKLENLKQQINNIEYGLMPSARERVKLIKNIAPRDRASLKFHRETMDLVPKYQLQILELRETYEDTYSEIVKLYLKGQINE